MSRKQYSRYTVVVDNLSSSTPTSDIKYEFEAAGKVLHVSRDYKARCALVEFDRSGDAKWAWDKMDGFKMDGRRWKVDWASTEDFKMFGWRWTEGPRSPSPRRARSPSRSRSRSPHSPHIKDQKRDNTASPESERARSKSPPPVRNDE